MWKSKFFNSFVQLFDGNWPSGSHRAQCTQRSLSNRIIYILLAVQFNQSTLMLIDCISLGHWHWIVSSRIQPMDGNNFKFLLLNEWMKNIICWLIFFQFLEHLSVLCAIAAHAIWRIFYQWNNGFTMRHATVDHFHH